MRISTIRPGLLVALSVQVKGNVKYYKRDIETARIDETGAEVAKWETEREIALPEEHVAAGVVRSKARALISAVCSPSQFGLLCPAARETELDVAIEEAKALATEFNRTSNLSKISVYAFTGQVAEDDAKAIKAINKELRDLIDAMESGIKDLDVTKVREAASQAKKLGQMLSPEANERMKKAIDLSRAAATRIQKAVKAGEAAAVEIDNATLENLRTARTRFLDLEEYGDVAPAEATGRAIDLMPDTEAPVEPEAPSEAPAPRAVDLGPEVAVAVEAAPTGRAFEL